MEREALPDIILMDLQMPVLNGVQTLKIIRELYPNQKVIAQSAHALEGERSRTILTGFDDYISKPFSKEALLETIQKVLGG
jgi:CheY-like chemotaxis protein